MGASVGDDLVVEAEAKVYFVKKECSNTSGGNVFLCGIENYPLSKPMVDHDQKGIEAGGDRKVSDEVTRELLEGAGCGRADGGEWWNGRMGIGLVLLASSTACDILVNVGGKAGPPEFGCNELAGF